MCELRYSSKRSAQNLAAWYGAAMLVFLCGALILRPENSVNIWNLLWQSRRLINYTEQTNISGTDLGFFLGGGAPLRNDVTVQWGKQISKSEYEEGFISWVGGWGGGAQSQHPPPRSAPAFKKALFRAVTRTILWLLLLQSRFSPWKKDGWRFQGVYDDYKRQKKEKQNTEASALVCLLLATALLF